MKQKLATLNINGEEYLLSCNLLVEDQINLLKKPLDRENFKKLWEYIYSDFDWNYGFLLCGRCSKYFDIWWDPELFIWRDSAYLCQFCFKHISIWWDPNKFRWQHSKFLFIFCQDYKHIWGKDYVKWRIMNT